MPIDDSFTKILLHMNGADGSTTFVDEFGRTWFPQANAQIDTAQSKFGGASCLLDGTGDYLATADSDDFHLSNVDWTFDFWIRFNAVSGTGVNIFSQYVDANNFMDFYLYSNTLRFQHYAAGYTNGCLFTAPFTPSTGTWYHIAVARSGNTPLIFVGGTSLTITQTQTISGKTLSNLAAVFDLGAFNTLDAVNGWIDEFRFSKGIARWTADFTPPTEPYRAKRLMQVNNII